MKSNFLHPTKINETGKRYKNYPGPFAVDENDFTKIFPGIQTLMFYDYHMYEKGDLEPYNLEVINGIVSFLEPKTILEVGTYRGRTTYNMAKNSPKSKIITVDIANIGTKTFSGTDVDYYQSKQKVGALYKKTPVKSRIHQVYADSLSLDCQEKVDKELKGEKVDFAFIDAGHDYDSVRHNFEELVLPRLKVGGVVVFDDYNRPLSIVGVTHYLLEKAYKDGYVFYWYAPRGKPHTNEVIFLNIPEARTYNWRY